MVRKSDRRSMKQTRRQLPPTAETVRRVGRDLVLRRRELVGTVTFASPAVFTVSPLLAGTAAEINPGNSTMFPWVSGIAPLYEKYRFESLAFELISGNPTTAAGRVYMCVDTDVNDPVPGDALTLMGNHNAVSGSIWDTVTLNVDIRGLNEGMPWRYTGPRDAGDAYEPRTTYCGRLTVATAPAATTVTWDLYTSYTVRFSVEQLNTAVPGEVYQSPALATANTHFHNPKTLAQLSAGSIRVVVPGSGTVPHLTGGASASYAEGQAVALDVSNAADTLISYCASGFDPALTPYQLFDATATADIDFFDVDGASLTTAITSGLAQFTAKGTHDTQTWVAGQTGAASLTIYLRDVFAAFPRLKYAVPYLYTTAGVFATSQYEHDFVYSR